MKAPEYEDKGIICMPVVPLLPVEMPVSRFVKLFRGQNNSTFSFTFAYVYQGISGEKRPVNACLSFGS
jgi:hypothetical protein